MSNSTKQTYIKYFYLSDFFVSFALGMIPLMTVLSYLISSLTTSSFGYALMLALYNISTSLPKMHVAKKLSNKKKSFNYILRFKLLQLLVWFLISVTFFTLPNTSLKLFIFCLLYLIYAFIKGSVDILNIDIYSKVISYEKIGKFFGYKYSLNSLGEFIGSITLVMIFKFLKIDVNYGIIFMVVFVLDLLSFIMLYIVKPLIRLNEYENKETHVNPKASMDIKESNNVFNSVNTFIKEIYEVINVDSNFKVFLLANIISIIGASVASFFIPYGKDKLNLSMNVIAVANVLWLISKVVSSVLWGYIVDFVGSKYVMIGSRVALLFSYMIAIKLNSHFMFFLILIFHGISSSALVIMSQNIFIEMGMENGPIYAAINSIICLPFFVVMPLLTSFLNDKVGYTTSFIISSIPLFISLLLMLNINEKNKKI